MPFAAAAAVGGALIGADANRSAANTSADATREATAEQRRQYDLTREDYARYRELGVRTIPTLERDINAGITPADVMSDPGYQFGLNQGQQALDRRVAAMGGRVSGAALKAAARYGTDYASTGYNAEYQRRQDRLNRLSALAGLGQTATAGSAAAGQNAANQISALTQSRGDTQGAARLVQGNIWANAGNQIAAIYSRQQQPSSGWTNPDAYNSFMYTP